MVRQLPQAQIKVAYQMSTTNQSFLDMHYYLRHKGIKNNAFFLALYDTDLEGVDPRDPRLNLYMKKKILAECMRNYWYFIREVVRIPISGGEVNGGARYKLHRGNLALNFGFVLNWNMFLELPRQHGKTIAAIVRYLWCFLFGTRNSEFMFLNKKLDDSKLNLQRLKEIRAALPEYLRMDQQYGMDGKKLKAPNSVETITNPINNNKIKTAPSARNKILANSLGRGCTVPFIWYDEYAFIPFNWIIYQSATPAFSRAAQNARDMGGPYGMLITTTPGDLLTEEGQSANYTRVNATPFSEQYYDMTLEQLRDLLAVNTKSTFVYMRFTYQQLGSGEDYFDAMVKDLQNNWSAIRREVLLEWAQTATNSPFDKVDLDTVKTLLREPIREIMIGNCHYIFKVYEDINFRYPPIIGVDVAGGFNRDSSAITIIDSRTTKVCADFNCNYIPVTDLARVVYELITVYMPNAVVNVERNGGYGAAVLSYLLSKPEIKKNLYYEIKDKVFEERYDGIRTIKTTKKVKVYGTDMTAKTRDQLMEILKERMRYHKDKFISKRLYDELCQLEIKKNGRIEHVDDGHDDQVFSYLLALYVWYEGQDLMSRFGIEKTPIRTEEDFINDEPLYTKEIMTDLSQEIVQNNEDVEQQLNILSSQKAILQQDFARKQHEESIQELYNLLQNNPLALKAYCKKYHADPNELRQTGYYTISDDVFNQFYSDSDEKYVNILQNEFNNITDLR